MKPLALVIDQGTTQIKVSLFDTDLNRVTQRAAPTQALYPQAEWVEFDGQALLEKTGQLVSEVLTSLPSGASLVGVGFANQGESVVAWHRRTGQILSPVISWQCSRGSTCCHALLETHPEAESIISKKTGLCLDPYFSAPKIHWLIQNIPGVSELIAKDHLCIGTLDSLTFWQWSRDHNFVTDPSTACRTLLYNIHNHHWDEELLKLFEIPISILPDIHDHSDSIAYLDRGPFEIHPLTLHAAFCDQPASLLGHGLRKPGETKCTYGTGAFILTISGTEPTEQHGKLLNGVLFHKKRQKQYYLEGGVFSAASAVNWACDLFNDLPPLAEWNTFLTTDSSHLIFIPALNGLAAPHWTREAKSAFFGLNHQTTSQDIIKAVLEGVAFRVAEVIDAIEHTIDAKIPKLSVDGGLCENHYLMQFQANLLQKPIVVKKERELTSLGLALWIFQNTETPHREQNEAGFEATYSPIHQGLELSHKKKQWQQAMDAVLGMAR